MNHAGGGAFAVDIADHDHELAVARDELARAVERVDEEDAFRIAVAGKGLGLALLCDDRHVRKQLVQPLTDQLVGLPVGFRDRIARALEIDAELGGVHLTNQDRGFARDGVERLE